MIDNPLGTTAIDNRGADITANNEARIISKGSQSTGLDGVRSLIGLGSLLAGAEGLEDMLNGGINVAFSALLCGLAAEEAAEEPGPVLGRSILGNL